MSDSSTSEPESSFVCDCEEWMRSTCAGEPFYKDHEGKRYCVLHFPGRKNVAIFEKVLKKKLDNKDYDFNGVWFPNALSFSHYSFEGIAKFAYATFSAEADFRCAIFSDVSFQSATFSAT